MGMCVCVLYKCIWPFPRWELTHTHTLGERKVWKKNWPKLDDWGLIAGSAPLQRLHHSHSVDVKVAMWSLSAMDIPRSRASQTAMADGKSNMNATIVLNMWSYILASAIQHVNTCDSRITSKRRGRMHRGAHMSQVPSFFSHYQLPLVGKCPKKGCWTLIMSWLPLHRRIISLFACNMDISLDMCCLCM